MAVFDEDKWKHMGMVCDWCGKVGKLRSCAKGCTKICVDCFDSKKKKDGTTGWKWAVCKVCGETIQRS